MKSIKILLGAACAVIAMSLAANADVTGASWVDNGHGQRILLYTGGPTYIGLYAGQTTVVAAGPADYQAAPAAYQNSPGPMYTIDIKQSAHGNEPKFLFRQCAM
jgi:hypothetical protein